MDIESEDEPLEAFEQTFIFIRDGLFPHLGAIQVALLVDESERILGETWAPELMSNLRALLSNRPRIQNHLGLKMAGSSNFYAKITEEGSPLRNILLKRFLPLLSTDEMAKLINQPTEGVLPEAVVAEIMRQAGGHPFLVQYVMHYLWAQDLVAANVDTVAEIVARLPEEKNDFEDWCDHIGPVGESIYGLLCAQKGWVKRSDIWSAVEANPDAKRDAVTALTYHGLVHHDRRRGYCVAGAMFRDWFTAFRQSG